MSHHKTSWFIVVVLISLAVTFGACDYINPPAQNTPIDATCDEQSLIEALEKAHNDAGPDVINLYPNCIYILKQVKHTRVFINGQIHHSGLPHIQSEITIYGNNAEIDIQIDPGDPYIGHFLVDSNGDLELFDLTLKNGARFAGGAVIVLGGELYVSNTKFLNNLAYSEGEGTVGRGGAIYNDSGTIRIIDNSLFQDNLAGYANISDNHLGGAIFNLNGTLIIYSATFDDNAAIGNGGAIYSEKNPLDESNGMVTIDGSSFIDNWAYEDGGALYLNHETNGVIITTSEFLLNHADESGGAIFSKESDLAANFDVFKNNQATNGGAIFSRYSDLDLHENQFRENSAENCGAIMNGGTQFTVMGEGELGTAIQIISDLDISGGYFYDNQATLANGGAICHLEGYLSIQGTAFHVNQAEEYGGALMLVDDSELVGLLVHNNSARRGGGIAVGYLSEEPSVDPSLMGISTEISSSFFSSNQASSGGGLWAHHGGSVLITHSLFSANDSFYSGGGITQKGGDLYINNSTFYGNQALNGGGLYSIGYASSTLGIKHSTFAYNVATNDPSNSLRAGGGGLNINGTVILENSLVTLNTNKDCDLNQGLTYTRSGNYDSDSTCGVYMTKPDPMIGSLTDNGGDTKTVALQEGSPLIDTMTDCAGLTDDQRGVTRFKGNACDPGAYEFDPLNPPDPSRIVGDPEPKSSVPPDSSENCPSFEDLDISVVLLNVPADTLVLPLYFRFPGSVPGQDEAEFKAYLGHIESNKCDGQGFEDRLYCMFNLTPDLLGMALDLMLYIDDCEDPSYSLLKVSIPELKESSSGPKPQSQCSAGLNTDKCQAAGGDMSDGVVEAPYCICP